MSASTQRPDLLTFQIIWLGYDEDEIGWDEVRHHDLTDAIAAACIRMSAGRGFAAEAHGFFVRRKEDA